jgi:hypothetical protein
MEHDATVVEQRLDVDELERRVMILDHTLAEFKTPRSFQSEPARPFEIPMVRSPEDSGRLARIGRRGVFRIQGFLD